jgi:hypothetical protein
MKSRSSLCLREYKYNKKNTIIIKNNKKKNNGIKINENKRKIIIMANNIFVLTNQYNFFFSIGHSFFKIIIFSFLISCNIWDSPRL